MNSFFKPAFVLACLLGAATASAQQKTEAQAPGEGEAVGVGITHLAIKPTAGLLAWGSQQRFAGGALIDMNLLNTPWFKLGPATGAIYSSMSGTSFFSGVGTGNNNYIFQIPANLKLSFSPDPGHHVDIGVHGGANIVRTNTPGGGVAFGGTTPSGNLAAGGTTSWDLHPNVGADLEFPLTTGFWVSLRPDWTLMPAFNAFTGTLSLALAI